MAQRRKKKNTQLGKKATIKGLTIMATVAAHKGYEAIQGESFMADDMIRLGISGGVAAVGFGAAVMSENEYIEAVATGISSGAAVKATDEGIRYMAMQQAAKNGGTNGLAGAADDFLNLYHENGGVAGVDEVQIRGMESQTRIR